MASAITGSIFVRALKGELHSHFTPAKETKHAEPAAPSPTGDTIRPTSPVKERRASKTAGAPRSGARYDSVGVGSSAFLEHGPAPGMYRR